MTLLYIEGQTFSKKDYRKSPLEKWEYEHCTFIHCDFSDSDISHIQFSACEFRNCNLSMSKMIATSLQNITFKDSKILGVQFDTCNNFLLEFSFENCILNFASFYGMKIPKTKFRECSLQEVNFTGTDICDGIFENCDLAKTIFDRTNLESVDFRSSYNYMLDPENNSIEKAKFSLSGTPGLLTKYDIIVE